MRICWDNLEKVRYNKKTKTFREGTRSYYEIEGCLNCGETFIGQKYTKFCTPECAKKIGEEHPMFGKTGKKSPLFGIKRPNHALKISGKNHPNWKGGVKKKGIPLYDTFVPQLEPYEQCRRDPSDPNILEVKCTYCGKWYIPTIKSINNRIAGISKHDINRFYCSDGCKQVCPLFNKSIYQLIKRDMVAAGRILPEELSREVQPELRQMVLLRDNYTCVKCSNNKLLHCHHIDPVINNPIESVDVDNCVTLCIDCHKEMHKLPGCTYRELRCVNE